MDLSTLCPDIITFVLQRISYKILPRVRMASKSMDNFIEIYRRSISKYCVPQELHVRLISSEKPLDWHSQKGYFYFMNGLEVVEIEDPYKELSAILLEDLTITRLNQEIPEGLQSPSTVFPLLRKLRPIVENLEVKNLTTEEILKLAEIVRCKGITIRQPTSIDGQPEAVLKSKTVQKCRYVFFHRCWSEEEFCSSEIITNISAFAIVCLFKTHPLFISSMIEHLRVMPELGMLSAMECTLDSDAKLFNNPSFDPPQNQLLWADSDNESYIHIIDGVNKWLLFLESSDDRDKWSINMIVRDKDPLNLLRIISCYVFQGECDYSSIQDEFINAPDMETCHKIFQSFCNTA